MEFNSDIHSIHTEELSVGKTPTIAASDGIIQALRNRGSRHTLSVYNKSSDDVFFGGSDVTVTNGVPIAAGETVNFPVNSAEAVYLVAAAVTKVNIAEYSV